MNHSVSQSGKMEFWGDPLTLEGALMLISGNIHAAELYLGDLHEAAQDIAAAGAYPAVPSEQWQNRGSGEKYLYMIFKTNQAGSYLGPDGARKVYVGNKPENIQEARRLAENRRRLDEINACIQLLEDWLRIRRFEVNRIITGTYAHPRTECELYPQG